MNSRIMDGLINSMQGFTPSPDGGVRAVFSFADDFAGFQGHFPEQKILPGVCLVQCAVASLGKVMSAELDLTEVINAKFKSVVSPGDVVDCTCTPPVEKNGSLVFGATLKKAEELVAKLTLSVSLPEKPAGDSAQ